MTGGFRGIDVGNYNSGALTITVKGDVSTVSTTDAGIYARNTLEPPISR